MWEEKKAENIFMQVEYIDIWSLHAIGNYSTFLVFHQEDKVAQISRFVWVVSTFQRVPLLYQDKLLMNYHLFVYTQIIENDF